MPQPKCEVPLATTHVGEVQRLRQSNAHPTALPREMRNDFEVMIDLPMFVSHRSPHLAIEIQDAQAGQPILGTRAQQPGVLLVVLPGGSVLVGGAMINQPRSTVFLEDELPVPRRRAQQAAAKILSELLRQPRRHFGQCEVLRHVPGGMPQRQGKIQRPAQLDRATKDLLRQLSVDRLGQNQSHKAAVGQAGHGFLSKDFDWFRWTHADAVWDSNRLIASQSPQFNRARTPPGPRLCD